MLTRKLPRYQSLLETLGTRRVSYFLIILCRKNSYCLSRAALAFVFGWVTQEPIRSCLYSFSMIFRLMGCTKCWRSILLWRGSKQHLILHFLRPQIFWNYPRRVFLKFSDMLRYTHEKSDPPNIWQTPANWKILQALLILCENCE